MQKRTALLSALLVLSSFSRPFEAAGYDVRLNIDGGAVVLKDVPEGTYRASVTPQDGYSIRFVIVRGEDGKPIYPSPSPLDGEIFKMMTPNTPFGVFELQLKDSEIPDIDIITVNTGDFETDNLYYKILNGSNSIELVGSKAGLVGDVVIPATVEYDGHEYRVDIIGESSFQNQSEITNIKIEAAESNRELRIRKNAFKNCTSLRTLDLPKDIFDIYPSMIDGCIRLTSIINRSPLIVQVASDTKGNEEYGKDNQRRGIVMYYTDGAYAVFNRHEYWKSFNLKALSTYNPDKIFTLTLNLQGENDGKITLYDAQPGQKMQFIGASNSTAPVVRINRTKMALDEDNTLTIPDNLPAGNLLLTLNDNSQTSSVEDVDTPPCYSVDGNILSVNSIDGRVVRVYNMLGECLFCGTDSELILFKGVYVVKTGNVAEKILIK